MLGGGSAGGGLAAAVALRARDRGDVRLSHQYLVYPSIDDRPTPSADEIVDPRIVNGERRAYAWRSYLGDLAGAADLPLDAAPGRATVDDLRGLPPTYLDVGELDPMRDGVIAYAVKLLQAGVPCELHVTPGIVHGGESVWLRSAVARRILGYRHDFMRRTLSP